MAARVRTEGEATLCAGFIPADLTTLPAVVDTEVVAGATKTSTDHVYAAVKAGTFPIQPLKFGRVYRWRTADLLRLLGADAGSQ